MNVEPSTICHLRNCKCLTDTKADHLCKPHPSPLTPAPPPLPCVPPHVLYRPLAAYRRDGDWRPQVQGLTGLWQRGAHGIGLSDEVGG